MADKPILFSGPMVRALLAGTKTQTRRIFKPQPTMHDAGDCTVNGHRGNVDYLMREIAPKHWLRIKAGDRLWVREAWTLHDRAADVGTVAYLATFKTHGWTQTIEQFPRDLTLATRVQPVQRGWRPSIHMPRWASRLTLTVTNVRVQRLQDCTDADALAEGVGEFFRGPERLGWPAAAVADVIAAASELGIDGPLAMYRDLWDHINGAGSWDANPWVASYTFTAQRGNIDHLVPA